MNFCEVDIFYLYTRRNEVDLDAELDVDSDLGTFSWRPKGSGFALPASGALIASIHLDRVDSLVNRIAVAILDYLPSDIDGRTAVKAALELVVKIDSYRSQPVREPVRPRGVTLLNFVMPFSDATVD